MSSGPEEAVVKTVVEAAVKAAVKAVVKTPGRPAGARLCFCVAPSWCIAVGSGTINTHSEAGVISENFDPQLCKPHREE